MKQTGWYPALSIEGVGIAIGMEFMDMIQGRIALKYDELFNAAVTESCFLLPVVEIVVLVLKVYNAVFQETS